MNKLINGIDKLLKPVLKIDKLLKPILRISIVFAATAILFQLTTGVKLFNMDVITNTSRFMSSIGNETIMGVISILVLIYFFNKK